MYNVFILVYFFQMLQYFLGNRLEAESYCFLGIKSPAEAEQKRFFSIMSCRYQELLSVAKV